MSRAGRKQKQELDAVLKELKHLQVKEKPSKKEVQKLKDSLIMILEGETPEQVFILTKKQIADIVDSVIQGRELGKTRREISSQVDLLLDKESQEAIKESRKEYEECKLKRYDGVSELVKDLRS